jgi:RNA polymerase sigma factor (sigma-70 family)
MTLTATPPAPAFTRHLEQTSADGSMIHSGSAEHHLAETNDAALLRRFILRHDESAFSGIVQRHGPMVLRACQRIVGRTPEADDAFQATFMVLVRRASAIQPPDMLGPWLHGVACRCALAARQQRSRHQQREKPLVEAPPVEDTESNDWLPYLDQEIQKLPEIYRRPVVLCELEGRSRKEAAELLCVAEGTLSSRLASARKRLAQRLGKRGLLGLAVLGSWFALESSASAAVPESLVDQTTRLGMQLLEHPATVAVAPQVASLSHGAMQSMFYTKCKLFALVAVGIGCLGYGCWFLGNVGAAEPQSIVAPLADDDQNQANTGGQSKRGSVNSTSGQNTKPNAQSPRSGQQQGTVNTTKATDGDDDTIPKRSQNNQETITGSGTIKTETRDVSGFRSVLLQNAGSVTIKQTGKEKLTVTTDDNLLPLLLAEVEDGKLVLKNAKSVNMKPSKNISYTMEVKELANLQIDGAGKFNVVNLDGDACAVTINGAGTITLQGKSGKLSFNIHGSGYVQAEDLQADKVSVSIPGSGTAIVNASESLKVSIQGSGAVEYVGNPEVTKKIQGSGTVKQRANKGAVKP